MHTISSPVRLALTTGGRRWPLIALWLAGGLSVAFGLMTLETAFSIWRHVPSLSLSLMSALISHDFTWGGDADYLALKDILAQYYAHSGRMVLHTAMGALVVSLGISQFIPPLRRRYPALHRRCGAALASCMVLSTTGAMVHLASVGKEGIFSGPTFFAFLWGLAIIAMFLLAQAALAILSRDFRGHMAWMAACFAAYLTAPLLRIDWMIFASLQPLTLQRVNAGCGTLVMVQALFVMAFWLQWVGDADLPARQALAPSRWPRGLLRLLALVTAAAALNEGLLAPLGLGLLPWPSDMPLAAIPWALATALAAWWSVDAWDSWTMGLPADPRFLMILLASGAAALGMGLQLPQANVDEFTRAFFWEGLGTLQLLAAVLAWASRPNSLGRNAWGILSLFLLWTPALMAVISPILLHLGLRPSEALDAAGTLAVGATATAGLMTGMGARLRWRPDARRA